MQSIYIAKGIQPQRAKTEEGVSLHFWLLVI